MTTLYLLQPNATLGKKQEAFQVAIQQPDRSWVQQTIAAQTVQQIVLMGHPRVTGQAVAYALQLKIPIHHLSYFGQYLGSVLPGYSRNGQLRLAQYAVYQDESKRLGYVQVIAAAKIHHQGVVLARRDGLSEKVKQYRKQVKEQRTVEQVRGVEGIAARDYFRGLQELLDPVWVITGTFMGYSVNLF